MLLRPLFCSFQQCILLNISGIRALQLEYETRIDPGTAEKGKSYRRLKRYVGV
jgi:hypothetical protein